MDQNKLKMYRNLLFVLGIIALNLSAFSQTDSAQIQQVYSAFETTVKNKEGAEHLDLYAARQAPVYIVRKNPLGPSTLGMFNAQGFVNNFTSNPQPYELKISDINYHIDSNFAVTDARFDEYISGNLSGYGRDLFGYVKTNEGWKLLFLHNTVVFNSDTTDYSTPHSLVNSVEDVLIEFNHRFNNHSANLTDLFMRMDNQVILMNPTFPENYSYFQHELRDYMNIFLDSLENPQLNLVGTDTIYCDDYLATVFADYTLADGNTVLEEGRCYFTFFANMQYGWRLSSWIRENRTTTTTSIDQHQSPELNVYPNPVKEMLNIEFTKNEPVNWKIQELATGQVILAGKQTLNQQPVNVNHLKAGTYLLSVSSTSGNLLHRSKLVIQ